MSGGAIRRGILFAVLAAALYAVNAPVSKLLLERVPPTLLAGILYLGAGCGMAVLAGVRRIRQKPTRESGLTRAELPFTVAMILLDIAAPVCLLFGLKETTAANASLLNNFEIVATALIALLFFREKISLRLWLGILAVTAACLLLSLEDLESLRFSTGSLLILLACALWGLENNCTKRISSKDPLQIVFLKGIFSGLGSVVIGICLGEKLTEVWPVFAALGLGFVAYGLSIFFYVHAQRQIGAARTSAYYAVAPFLGVLISLAIFRELPTLWDWVAFGIMIFGAWLCSGDGAAGREEPPAS